MKEDSRDLLDIVSLRVSEHNLAIIALRDGCSNSMQILRLDHESVSQQQRVARTSSVLERRAEPLWSNAAFPTAMALKCHCGRYESRTTGAIH